MITVVGARSDLGGHVYFIDPKDSSDPAARESQKIYVMPYEKFRSCVVDLNGIERGYWPDLYREGCSPSDEVEEENCFALHAADININP